jgi:hypothetical protein
MDKETFVNTIRDLEKQILAVLEEGFKNPDINKRWLSIAKTHVEEGRMAAVRSVFEGN